MTSSFNDILGGISSDSYVVLCISLATKYYFPQMSQIET